MTTITNSPSVPADQARQRRFTLRGFQFVLVVIALGITGYLSYITLMKQSAVCVQGGIFNCDVVLNSIFSRFMGIPVAYLGFGMWILIGSVLLLEKRGYLSEYTKIIVFGLALFSFCYHCYLTYNAAFTLRALCPWCLAAHTTMTIMLVVASIRLYRSLQAPATETKAS